MSARYFVGFEMKIMEHFFPFEIYRIFTGREDGIPCKMEGWALTSCIRTAYCSKVVISKSNQSQLGTEIEW